MLCFMKCVLNTITYQDIFKELSVYASWSSVNLDVSSLYRSCIPSLTAQLTVWQTLWVMPFFDLSILIKQQMLKAYDKVKWNNKFISYFLIQGDDKMWHVIEHDDLSICSPNLHE